MKTFLTLVLIGLLAAGAFWYFTEGRKRSDVQDAQHELASGAERMKDAIQDKLKDFSLRTDDIKEELSRSGKVVRQKARQAGAAVADATADLRVSAAIKAKLVADPDLSALSISVNVTDGVVTLSGSVSSHEHIGKAILLALESEGVREVISTLQVRQTKP
jgi:hyperosmotically inducible protein